MATKPHNNRVAPARRILKAIDTMAEALGEAQQAKAELIRQASRNTASQTCNRKGCRRG